MIIERKELVDSHPGVEIWRVEGLIKLGESAFFLQSALRNVRSKKFVMDLELIDYIDSTGIGEFVGACAKLIHEGRKIVLVHPSQRITKLLAISKLSKIIKVFDDGEEAASSLDPQ
jgi:anti-anti-sigma factor